MDDSRELVMMPVPQDRVEEVYKLLASPPSAKRTPRPDQNRTDDDEWTRSDFAHVVDDKRPSFEIVRRMLDFLAENPDQELSVSAVCTELGIERERLRGSLSGFARAAKKIADDLPWWPAESTEGEMGYMVTALAADRWKAVRGD